MGARYLDARVSLGPRGPLRRGPAVVHLYVDTERRDVRAPLTEVTYDVV